MAEQAISGSPPQLEIPEHFPSLSACLEQCIHFERQPKSGPAAQRGTRIHHYIFEVLTGVIPFEMVPRSYRKQVARAMECASAVGGELLLAEDEIYAEITGIGWIPCTPDFVLQSEGEIVSINWKTGSERDYKLPQRFYSVALCQKFNVEQVTIIECYVDLGHAAAYTLGLDTSNRMAGDILKKYAARASHSPSACEYCRWCAKGPTGDRSCHIGCAQLVRA